MGNRRSVEVTFALPAPAAGAASRVMIVSSTGVGAWGMPATLFPPLTATAQVFDMVRNASVHVDLYDLDASGNYIAQASCDFVATTAAAPPVATKLAAPVVVEIPMPVPSLGAAGTAAPVGAPQNQQI